ncbi:hypothetical protein SAY87_029663 [Trapa incisa]|uniref:Uncharacterized protein n=1 Tax=Trapa incisa TaxID=236973 RepID=A0AAN7Q9J5_9MYRT|nr:hypothetical protein SAY87_029663 [Trapa incisa]
MDLACGVLRASCTFHLGGSLGELAVGNSVSRFCTPLLQLGRTPARKTRLCLKGGQFLVHQWRVPTFHSATAISCEETQGHLSSSGSVEPGDRHGGNLVAENGNEHGGYGDEYLDAIKMVRVCDKLIDVFLVDKPTPTDWRRLLAFSKEWPNIRPHFYKRCQDRADTVDDPGMKHKLLRFSRKLKEVDDDVQRHNELLEVLKSDPSQINDVVSRRRKDFTDDFFLHVHTVAESYHDNPSEQNLVAKLGNMCLAAVQAYDTAGHNVEAVKAAEVKIQDIINSPSLDAACRKIDDLAAKNQLDSAMVLMITKAWSAAKESSMMKDEVKDILYHLYMTARGNLQRLMPKEIRILKYLLMIEDPEERDSALRDAFTPGEELQGKDVDYLFTTPEELHVSIRTILDAYHSSREGTLIREARDLMNPVIVDKLEKLKKTMESKYM